MGAIGYEAHFLARHFDVHAVHHAVYFAVPSGSRRGGGRRKEDARSAMVAARAAAVLSAENKRQKTVEFF